MWAGSLFENTDYSKRKASGHSIAPKSPKFNYVYNLNGDYTQLHHDNGYGFPAVESFQWLYANTDWQVEGFKIHFSVYTIGTKVLGNDFQFSKIDFKTEFEKKYLNGQKKNLLFEAGFAIGDIPLTHLYNTSQITLQRNHYSKNHLSGKKFWNDVLQRVFLSWVRVFPI
jgi:hypothetical protein